MVQMHPTLGLGSGENLKFEICLPACGPCPAFLALATNYPTLRQSSSKWRQFEGKEREREREEGRAVIGHKRGGENKAIMSLFS